MQAFDSGLYDTTNMGTPEPLPSGWNAQGRGGSFALSATNNSVQLLTTGAIDGSPVTAVLFNLIQSASAAPAAAVTLTSPNGTVSTIRISANYYGETIALLSADGISVEYVAAAGTLAPGVSGRGLVSDPNHRRKRLLGYI